MSSKKGIYSSIFFKVFVVGVFIFGVLFGKCYVDFKMAGFKSKNRWENISSLEYKQNLIKEELITIDDQKYDSYPLEKCTLDKLKTAYEDQIKPIGIGLIIGIYVIVGVIVHIIKILFLGVQGIKSAKNIRRGY